MIETVSVLSEPPVNFSKWTGNLNSQSAPNRDIEKVRTLSSTEVMWLASQANGF